MKAKAEVSAAQRRRLPLLARIASGLVIGLLIAAAVGTAASVAWLKQAMRDQLPVLDGQQQLPGLTAPVLVRRDVHGIPHIQAANMDDLLEAQGFVAAQDRLWQMDMGRRFAAGELAELLGSSVVEHDKLQRILQIRPAAEQLTATMPEDQRRLLEAFARGVNAYIAGHQDNLPAEFRLLGYKPRPWQPVDSWLVTLNMVWNLDTLYPWKLEREKVEAKLAPNLIAQLYPTTTWRDHPPTQSIPDLTAPQQNIPDVPLDESQSSLEDLLRLREILQWGAGQCDSCRRGSNEWAVSGAHTASGKAMLSKRAVPATRGRGELEHERLGGGLLLDEGGDGREGDEGLRLEYLALDRVYLLVDALDPGLHVQRRVDVGRLAEDRQQRGLLRLQRLQGRVQVRVLHRHVVAGRAQADQGP